MNEVEMLAILRYLEVHLPEPNIRQNKFDFEKRSYARWTATEIVHRLMDKPYKPARDVIDDFIVDMTYMSFMTLDVQKERICNISIEVAYDILEFIEIYWR